MPEIKRFKKDFFNLNNPLICGKTKKLLNLSKAFLHFILHHLFQLHPYNQDTRNYYKENV